MTDTTEKANTHNQQFQSVFTTKAPLSLSRLCKMQIQDMTDNGTMCHDAVPAGVLNSSPKMEEFNGILNTVIYVISCRNFWLQYRNIQDGGPNKHENVCSFEFGINTLYFHFKQSLIDANRLGKKLEFMILLFPLRSLIV